MGLRRARRSRRPSRNYEFITLDGKAVEALKPGRNVLAVSCRQTREGQFIDAGLIQLKSAPPATAGDRP